MYSSVACTEEAVPVSVARGDELQLGSLDFIKMHNLGFLAYFCLVSIASSKFLNGR